MTLILFFTVIYLANISNALVCYQCNGAPTVSNPSLKFLVDFFTKKFVDQKRIDSPNIFCNKIDDLGIEKTCDPGSYCYSRELQLLSFKENIAVRSCVKQDQEYPDIMECTEEDDEIFNKKEKECRCDTNKCNGHENDDSNTNGNTNGNSNNSTDNGNGNISGAPVCYQCNGASKIFDPTIKMKANNLLKQLVEEKKLDSPNIFCRNLDDLGVEKTCDPGSYCFSGEFDILVPKEKVAIRSCFKQDPETPDTLACLEVDWDGGNVRLCWCNTNECNKGSPNRGSGGNFIILLHYYWRRIQCTQLSSISTVFVIALLNLKQILIFRLLGKSLHHSGIHPYTYIIIHQKVPILESLIFNNHT